MTTDKNENENFVLRLITGKWLFLKMAFIFWLVLLISGQFKSVDDAVVSAMLAPILALCFALPLHVIGWCLKKLFYNDEYKKQLQLLKKSL